MFESMGEFVAELERRGELVRVSEAMDLRMEIAELADRASKARAPGDPSDSARRRDPERWDRGGPAILIERPKLPDGSISPIPVLINAFGSYRRMELALRCDAGFDALGAKIGSLAKPVPPRGLGEAIAKAKEFAPLLKVGPKRAKRAACHEVVARGEDVNVLELPVIRCWPHDGDFVSLGYPSGVNEGIEHVRAQDEDVRGRYITLAGIHTVHADDRRERKPASHNIGSSSASGGWRCTGTSTTTALRTGGAGRSSASPCRWRSCSAARRSCRTPRRPRSRPGSRSSSWRASFTAGV